MTYLYNGRVEDIIAPVRAGQICIVSIGNMSIGLKGRDMDCVFHFKFLRQMPVIGMIGWWDHIAGRPGLYLS